MGVLLICTPSCMDLAVDYTVLLGRMRSAEGYARLKLAL